MPLPVLAGVAGFLKSAAAADLAKNALTGVFEFEPALSWLQQVADKVVPNATERWTTFLLETRADYMVRLVHALMAAQDHVAPQMATLAVMGIEDVFGVGPAPAALVSPGGSPTRVDALRPIGDALIGGLFGFLGGSNTVTPDAGYDNLLRLIERTIRLGIEDWLTSTLGLGPLTKDLPGWGELGNTVTRAIGLGRVASRAMRPLIDGLVLEPAKRKLNSVFLTALPSEAQLARLLHRGQIGEENYTKYMGELGWPPAWSAELRLMNSTMPGRSDLRAMLEQELTDPAGVKKYLVAQGYPPETADVVVEVMQNDRVRASKERLVSIARELYIGRNAERDELEEVLGRVGYTETEKEWVLSGADLERSKAKRVTEADMESAYVADLAELSELEAYYTWEGYAERDVDILVSLAVKRKQDAEAKAAAKKPKPRADSLAAVSRSVAREAHRRGLLTDAGLRDILVAQGLQGPALETLMQVSQSQRAQYVAALQAKQAPKRTITAAAGTVEEAYRRGLVSDEELQAFYIDAGFNVALLPMLLELRKQERDEYLERRAAAAARAAGLPASSPPA